MKLLVEEPLALLFDNGKCSEEGARKKKKFGPKKKKGILEAGACATDTNTAKMPAKAKHLGLPLLFPRSKRLAMADLKDRLLDKLSGWRAKLLSQAGRGILIRSVATPLLAYPMSFFEMPKSWSLEVDKSLKKFWWAHSPEKSHNLSLKSWSSMCRPKFEGGLGFRISSDFNISLLTKLAWSVASNRPSLWVTLMKGKYLHQTGFWEVEATLQASRIWKGILSMRKFLEKGFCYLIGNGENVAIWRDPWIPSIPGFKPSPNSGSNALAVSVVADLIDPINGQWNRSLL
ncbi:hypothetical protein CJ030_MR7G005007 [Morella rubra]|uniref:Uncharacterized protein n=1 Tax=Morella rubra TaxID=262757 RepID=A0A6A1WX18_9ROSI|nr:hypothetical protein CJ030_MR7G005007 [Morella rubra]